MNEFLKYTKKLLTKQDSNILHIVMGNQSCDLDSAISALTYAHLIHNLNKTSNNKAELVIPVFNIRSKELPLKTEVTHLLKRKNIEIENIVCRDQIDLNNLFDSQKLKLSLVDYHVLPETDHKLKPAVTNVIDHRPQDPNWTWSNIYKVIEPVGSCCTLIVKEILKRIPDILHNSEISELLYATIILDTVNLSQAAKRVTPIDIEIIDVLKRNYKVSFDNQQIFDELSNARKDISNISSFLLLYKDLKIVRNIALPGFPLLVCDFVKRSDALDALRAFCKETNCCNAVVMGLIMENNSVKRDIGVFNYNNCELAQKIINALKTFSNPSLQLTEVSCSINDFVLFSQKNIKVTRKTILPIIDDITKKV